MDDVALWERALTQAEIQQVISSSIQTPIAVQPYILVQPVGGSRGQGDRIVFTTRAAGQRPFSYQWYHGATEISGATSNVLVQSNITAADAGNYTVVVSNDVGSVESAQALLLVTGK